MKKGGTKDYADLLRQLETKRLSKGKGSTGRREERGERRKGEKRGKGAPLIYPLHIFASLSQLDCY